MTSAAEAGGGLAIAIAGRVLMRSTMRATRRHGDDGGHCSAGARPGCFRGCAGCAQGARRGDLCRTRGLTPETRLRRTAPISGALAASYKSGGRGAHCRGSAGGERGAGGWCFFATKTWRRASGGVSTLARAREVFGNLAFSGWRAGWRVAFSLA